MRRLLLLFAVLVIVAPTHASDDETLVATEKSMWEMWKQKDAKSFGALLADDFYDVYLSGETVGKAELMRGFADADLLGYELGPMHVVPLADGAKLLVYRAHVRGRVKDLELEYDVDVTSAWARRGRTWKAVFYRENLVAKALPWSNLTSSL